MSGLGSNEKKSNPFKENQFDKSKKSGENDGGNSLENIKNPFGSNAKPVNTSHRRGDNSYRRNGNKPLIDPDKFNSQFGDSKKSFLLNNGKKGNTEQKIVKDQSIGLAVVFVIIVVLIFLVINFGKYLIRDYNVKNPEESYSYFPDGEKWRGGFDYQTLINPELISGPDRAGNFNPAFFCLSFLFQDKSDNNNKVKLKQEINKDVKAAVGVYEEISKEINSNIQKKNNKSGGGGKVKAHKNQETGDCECLPEDDNRHRSLFSRPLFFYWVWSAISLALLIFNKIVRGMGNLINKVYKFSNKEEDGKEPVKMGRVATFLYKILQDLFFIVFLVFFVAIIPVVFILFLLFSVWEFLWEVYVYDCWNRENVNYLRESNDSSFYADCTFPTFWKFWEWFKFFFFFGLTTFINGLFKSLTIIWGPILIFGKFSLLGKILIRLYSVVFGNKAPVAKEETKEPEGIFINSSFRTGAAFFIIMACVAFTKIFAFEHLSYLHPTLSFIVFISIVLLNIFV